jgi:single-stranded-DNA-specific exonuclease
MPWVLFWAPELTQQGEWADLALELLTTQDKGAAHALARKLDELNKKRQIIELRVVDEALVQADAAMGQMRKPAIIVVAADGWHPGVVGLAASRLKDRFGVPSLVLAINAKTGLATGSGRSIAGVDLGKAVRLAMEQGHITKGGGHAMAAGLTVKTENLGQLRQFLDESLSAEVAALREPDLPVDGALTATAATLDLIELLEQAGPYGSAHPSPMFVFPSHRITFADRVGTDHVRCTLVGSDGTKLKAIAFRALGTELGELLLSERNHPLHVAGKLVVDEWGTKRVPSLQIEDAAIIR